MPALLTKMSSVLAWRAAAAMLAASVTSRTSNRASPPISSTARSPRAASREPTQTTRPASARWRAISLPMPLLAPVTSAAEFSMTLKVPVKWAPRGRKPARSGCRRAACTAPQCRRRVPGTRNQSNTQEDGGSLRGMVSRALYSAAGAGSLTVVSRISIVGVPSSAASYAAGQDLAPAALRSAGLLEQLTASGLEVHDDGDLPHQAWSPDRDHPLAQNADQATMSVQQLADRLHPLLARGDIALVLGGNCTIALGVAAALRRLDAGAPGLLYVDRHYDINTPQSTTDGALDWMGLAHALALPGCLDTLTDAFGRRPLLEADQVAWLGVEPRVATQWEREQADRLGLPVTTRQALGAEPPR